jgi:predicted DNA-binding transcriptional regulator AlpA
MSTSEDGPLLLNADEVAALLTVSRSTFNGMVKDGAFIEPILLGKRKRWLKSAILGWLNAASAAGANK